MQQATSIATTWRRRKKILFRFFFVYFFIYCFPFPFDAFDILKPIAKPVYDLQDLLIPGIGEKWFGIHAKTAFPFFDKVDDSGYGLVFLFINLIVSFIVSITWSFVDRRRKNYERLYQWLKLYLRFFLAAYLFGYGFIKVFPSQFQEISASRLTMLVGEQSPMLLAWNFMGHSTVFMKFMGWAEVIAGVFLLFRRTTTLGALLSFAVFSFVTLMDFCFNVPVTMLSSHLLLISFFLILEDRQKLVNILLLNKPTESTVPLPLIAHRFWDRIFTGVLVVLGISLLYSTIANSIKSEKEFGRKSPKVALYGVYKTNYFIRNHDTIPPLETDTLRWKQLVIDGGSWKQGARIEFSSGKKEFFLFQMDTIKKTFSIQANDDSTKKYVLHYSEPDKDHIFFNGQWKTDSIKVLMNKYDLNNFLLYKEKFKWIEDDE